MKHNRISILLAVLVLALSTLACVLPFGQPPAPTAQVITVVVQPSLAPTTAPLPPTAEPTIAPTLAPTPAPALPKAVFNGISFSYPQSLAANVSFEVVPASPASADVPTWDVYPQYTEFKFNGYMLSNTFHEASILIYPTAEYAAMQPYAAEVFSRLAQVLVSQPTSFPGNESLPFLPIFNAAQMSQSNVRYFRFANGSGVGFVTQYGQAAYPLNNNSLFYTYQGLTDDGKYYVSAILPVNNPALPNTIEEGIPNGDWQTFTDHFMDYIENTEPWMDSLPDDSFTPSLADLDAMLASLSVTP